VIARATGSRERMCRRSFLHRAGIVAGDGTAEMRHAVDELAAVAPWPAALVRQRPCPSRQLRDSAKRRYTTGELRDFDQSGEGSLSTSRWAAQGVGMVTVASIGPPHSAVPPIRRQSRSASTWVTGPSES
jgi:hypothetical protein